MSAILNTTRRGFLAATGGLTFSAVLGGGLLSAAGEASATDHELRANVWVKIGTDDTVTITVPTVDDTAIESSETLTLTVGGVPGTGTITDNDAPPVPEISGVTAEDAATAAGSGDSSVVEGNPLRYTGSLSLAPTAATTFSLAASGTAAAADYGSYSFSNGVTYSAATGLITVPAGAPRMPSRIALA